MLPDKNQLLNRMKSARQSWGPRPEGITPKAASADEESIWDYPRPPEIRLAKQQAGVCFAREIIAESDRALRLVETAGAPVYFFPPEDVATHLLHPSNQISLCEWKGAAVYFDIEVNGKRAPQAAFSYPDPLDDLKQGYSRIAGWFGFYASRVDSAFVGDEQVTAQPGDVYAGWVTSDIKGPIKGEPGSGSW